MTASPRWSWLLAAATIAAGVALVLLSPDRATALVERLGPVLLFVVAMSVVVNLAADAGAFDAIADGLRRVVLPGCSERAATWVHVVVLSTFATVFLSLDTTAIMVTPLAVALARRSGAGLWAIGLTVVWIANIGSLLLPVSNLTNLLAVSGGMFHGTGDYLAQMWRPAVVALAVAAVASWVAYRGEPGGADDAVPTGPASDRPGGHDRRLRISLIVLGLLVPLLVSPVPYWLSTAVAALVLVTVSLRSARPSVTSGLVPWTSLLFVTALSTVAAALHAAGAAEVISRLVGSGEDSTGGLLLIGGAGALLANLINNIPAFLALDVGVSQASGMAALLVGVNAGPIVTPWASLATLLWHDQLRRSGVDVPWRRYVLVGCVLVPIAVVLPILAI
ncbi:SLC13 family permease [Gordonia sp. (in: high G+C Gram-positive bacteria)]|uniref:SLC13 family permease n=1 Tax=Gordonia sp. (in: high G+C Gram-positive bacteria) TaxID=84139 RepID=UPI0016A883FA|nr:SLC13 family permease [Gordonia sp. (in: high G+C Gram-positive bacteria)]NLG45711.1 arsenic transporter [Gordonia sp. (in: high G+C Gram-positive bacteria)]